MKNKLIFSFFLFAFYSVLSQAQTTSVITGQITDGTNPVEFCNVLIQSTADTTYIKGAVSGADGRFSINAKGGNYKLKISLLGYGAVEKMIAVKGNTDLGELVIKPSEEQLDEVVVRANLVDALADRYVMNNLGKQKIAVGKSSLEVLRYAPGVWVSPSGAISINGQGNPKIMVNDRLLRLKDQQLTAYLDGLKAEDIKKIEIIPDPTAEYDADSSGGILSITLDRSKYQGISGSVNMRYGQSDYPMYMPSLNLNYNRNKIGVSLRYNFTYFQMHTNTDLYQDFLGSGTHVHQATDILNHPKGTHDIGLDFTYDISKKHFLGISVQGGFRGMKNDLSSVRHMWGGKDETQVKTNNTNDNRGKDIQVSANYVYRIKTGDELKIKADAYLMNFDMTISSLNDYFRMTGEAWDDMPYFESDYRQYSPQNSNIYSAGADYKHTFKNKSFIAAGVKFTYLTASNNTLFDAYENGGWQSDPSRSDDFDYNENISALYVKYDMKGKKWTYTFSARAEYYGTNAISNTLSETYRQRIIGVFPTVNIRYYIDRMKGTSIGMNIGRSINRRDFRDLNPNVIQESEFAKEYGDVFLDPSYVNKLGLSATVKYRYIFSLNYTLTDNQYETVVVADPNVENGTINTPAKIRYEHGINANVFIPVSVTKWWDVIANLNGGYLWYKLLDEERNSLFGRVMISSDFSLPSYWSLGLTWMANSSNVRGNKKSSAYQTVAFSVGKKILKKKASVSLTINDLFNSGNGGRSYYTAPNLYSYSKQFRETRQIVLSFRYNFDYGRKIMNKFIEKDMENKSRVM